MSAFDELLQLLDSCGARVTFDRGRNIQHPCTFCAAAGPHELRDIGRYFNGNTLTRPVCGECSPLADILEAQRDTEPAGE